MDSGTQLTDMPTEQTFRIAQEEHRKFVSALGELTLAWSDLEIVLFKLLKHYAGVSDDVGRALFSGTRARAAIAFIDAIADNTNMDSARRDDLRQIFAQIATLNQMRDFVIHNVDGSEQRFKDDNPSERLLSDVTRVSRKKNAKVVYIGSAILADMRADCIECCWRLHPHWDPQNNPFKPGSATGGRPAAWRFKAPSSVTAPRGQ